MDNATLPGPAIGAISSMVERREKGVQLISQALDALWEAKNVLPEYAFCTALANKVRWCEESNTQAKKALVNAVDRACWNELLDKTKLGILMNAEQLGLARKSINESSPELSLNCAMTTFVDLFENSETNFIKGLADLFVSLRGIYKSHCKFKIRDRIILAGALSNNGWSSFSRHRDRFDDLWKILYFLDGGDPTTVEYRDKPSSIISLQRCGQLNNEYHFEQFRVVTNKNGNIHIWLNSRKDLIEKINSLLSSYFGDSLPE